MRLFTISLIFLLTNLSVAFSQQRAIDSLERVLETPAALSDSIRIATALRLSDAYLNIDSEKSLQLAKRELLKGISYPLLKIRAWSLMSSYYAKRSEAKLAIEYADSGLALAEKLADKSIAGGLHHKKGSVYMEKGDYPAATDALFRALSIYEKLGNKRRSGLILNDLGCVYGEQDQFSKAKELHSKNLELGKQENDGFLQLIAHNNIALVYRDEKNYDTSLSHFHAALQLNDRFGHPQGKSLILANIAQLYLDNGVLDSANHYASKALAIAAEVGYQRVVVQSSAVLGAVLVRRGKPQQAIPLLEEARAKGTELEMAEELTQALDALYMAYEQTSQPAQALQTYKAFIAMRDSSNRVSNLKALLAKESEFKEEKLRLEQQNKDLENKAEIEKQARLKNTYLGISATFVIVLMLGLYSYTQQRKSNARLAQQNVEILSQKQEIEQTALELKKASLAIAEKNDELNEANEELYQQQEELIILNENMALQKREVERVYEELKSTADQLNKSIRYASDVQHAIMPSKAEILSFFEDAFIISRPKDVVSGDFYWFSKISENTAAVALADCTGHGVPGAFMSMLGSTLLHETVNVKGIADDPARVLRNLHSAIRKLLRQQDSKNSDGMDIAVAFFERRENGTRVVFAGAKSKMLLVHGISSELIAGDNQGVGGRALRKEFANKVVEVPPHAMCYFFTDGFADQHNPELKKIGSKALYESLINHHALPLEAQQERLEAMLQSHQGTAAQRDDISIVGLQLP